MTARTPEAVARAKERKRIRDAAYRERNRDVCRFRVKLSIYRAYERKQGAV